MAYCLDPACKKPHSADTARFCTTCGSSLWLKNRYRALELIGAGGMGRTFLGQDIDRLNSQCVIKQLLPAPSIQNHPEAMAKAKRLFKQEARQLFHLGHHPQIPSMYAFFEQAGHLYLVQEFIEGQDLSGVCHHNSSHCRPYSEAQIQQFLKELLPVLQFIHDHQVVHRDIKPANIVRRRNGEFVLIDFGISKQITGTNFGKTGSRVGTEGYAPLEQMRGGHSYPASDLYSLGVTCIQLLTQASLDHLYDPMNGIWTWQSVLQQQGRTVSQPLAQILDKMLQDHVSERYQSAGEILQDLETLTIFAGIVSPNGVSISVPVNSAMITPTLPKTWQCVQTLTGHTSEITSVALSPQAFLLASGSLDGTVKIWNLGTSKLLRTLRGHYNSVSSVAISPDGYLLASASWDRTVKIWHLGNGKLLYTLRGHQGYVHSVTFSPDGQTLISSSRDRTLKFWNPQTGQFLDTLTDFDAVRTIAISADAQMLASGGDDRRVKLWQLNQVGSLDTTPQSVLAGHLHCVRSLAFSPDRHFLASGSWDHTIKLWSLDAGVSLLDPPSQTLVGHASYVYCVTFDEQGTYLVSGSRDGTIKFWQIPHSTSPQNVAPAYTLTGHLGPVYSLALSLDCQLLVSGSDDTTIKIWKC
jgi:WD40 repeat protein/tRNA A-37 threonylcarbamoyl transferase component Bud32